MDLEVRERQFLQMGEEVVPHVVLDMARRADQNATLQEAEHAADDADGEEQGAVLEEFGPRHARREVVDRITEHDRRRERDGGRGHDRGQAEQELAAVRACVGNQSPDGSHQTAVYVSGPGR